jgi:hypothetical protein
VAEAVKRDTEPAAPVASTARAEQLRRRALSGHFQLRSLRPTRGLRPTRVGVAYFLLAAALAGAGTGVGLALTGSSGGSSAASSGPAAGNWSAWRPSGIGSTAIRQIASHVPASYRLPNGKPLVTVVPRAPALQGIPIAAFAIGSDTSTQGSNVLPVGNAVMYILCGSTPVPTSCVIPGVPSVERAQLVRREALELALYTFRYVAGVDTVLAFLPSVQGSDDKRLLLIRKSDAGLALGQPLKSTVGPDRTVKPGDLKPSETAAIDAVAVPRIFVLSNIRQLADDSLLLLLTPQALRSA